MGTSLIAPSLLLSILMSVGYGALFHLWRGRTFRDLILFIIVAVVGFGVGQLAGTLIRTPLLQVGEVHMLEATVGAWLALGVASLVVTPAARRA